MKYYFYKLNQIKKKLKIISSIRSWFNQLVLPLVTITDRSFDGYKLLPDLTKYNISHVTIVTMYQPLFCSQNHNVCHLQSPHVWRHFQIVNWMQDTSSMQKKRAWFLFISRRDTRKTIHKYGGHHPFVPNAAAQRPCIQLLDMGMLRL